MLEHLEVDESQPKGRQDQHEHDAVDGLLRHVRLMACFGEVVIVIVEEVVEDSAISVAVVV